MVAARAGATRGDRTSGIRPHRPGLAYLLHLRPLEWPIMAGHTLLGTALALGLSGMRPGPHLLPALLGVTLWVICLNGGTLAINSAVDQDEGDVAYLRNPPPPPKYLMHFGLGLMVLGQLAAWHWLPRSYALAYALCFLLSVLYSIPPARLKAVAGADWLINMWGFGTITPFAGWAATGLPLEPWARWVLFGFCPLFAALYPLTQLYQFEDDRKRGDRTFAIALGMERSLTVAVAAAALAFICFALGGLRAGWRLEAIDVRRWAALGFAAVGWAAVLLPWLARAERMTPAEHQRGMHRALGAWALTDGAVLFAWGS